MDTATLLTSYMVLREGSVRAVARRLGRPVSTVSDSVTRLEHALAVPLVSRSNGTLARSLAAENICHDIGEIIAGLRDLAEVAGVPAGGDGEDDMAPGAMEWLVSHAMSLLSLERYVEVVRAGSIRRAARRLLIGQPQLSRQMAHLEATLGRKLLARTGTGCVPTEAGEAAYEIALALSAGWRALTSPSNVRFSREQKTVRFGTIIPISYESRTAKLLARLVAMWSVKRTHHHLFMSCMTAQSLMDGMRDRQFDVALIDAASADKAFEQRPIFSSELAIVGPRGVAAAFHDGSLPSRHPLAIPSRRSGLRPVIAAVLASGGYDHDRWTAGMVELDSISIILSLVISQGYVSVFPVDAVPKNVAGIEIIRPESAPPISFHLVWQATPVARSAASEIADLLDASLV